MTARVVFLLLINSIHSYIVVIILDTHQHCSSIQTFTDAVQLSKTLSGGHVLSGHLFIQLANTTRASKSPRSEWFLEQDLSHGPPASPLSPMSTADRTGRAGSRPRPCHTVGSASTRPEGLFFLPVATSATKPLHPVIKPSG